MLLTGTLNDLDMYSVNRSTEGLQQNEPLFWSVFCFGFRFELLLVLAIVCANAAAVVHSNSLHGNVPAEPLLHSFFVCFQALTGTCCGTGTHPSVLCLFLHSL